jgi:UDP-N-acetyl-D-glucosamine dehydrogenase
MAMMCDLMGIDIWEVIDAAATKPFGFVPFYPGPGIGGHCIPLDPIYLSWKAKGFNFYSRFIEAAQQINKNMPNYIVNKVSVALNTVGKSVRNSKILILGMAYKKDIDDLRESPSIEIFELLRLQGAHVIFNDLYAPIYVDKYGNELESQQISKDLLNEMDCVLLLTDHSYYDYEYIAFNSKLVIDTRNAFKNVKGVRDHIIKIGS